MSARGLDPHDLIRDRARIRVFSGAIGCEDHVLDEGEVVAFLPAPSLELLRDDGRRVAYLVTLPRERVSGDPERSARIIDQPPPVPNDRPSVQSLVRADLQERERVGVQRYGTPLQPFNGRDALVDAYQEALDLACYLRQAIAERPEAPDG